LFGLRPLGLPIFDCRLTIEKRKRWLPPGIENRQPAIVNGEAADLKNAGPHYLFTLSIKGEYKR
jgi:hypothetical protein